MTDAVTHDDARAALAEVERGRRRVIDEFGMPRWYFWSVALGWIGLAVVTDMNRPVLTTVATVAFGAGHATVFNALSAGRHRTNRLSVRHDTVGWHAQAAIIGCLLGLAAVTVAGRCWPMPTVPAIPSRSRVCPWPWPSCSVGRR